jgi:pre-mRNA-splicing factor CWC26
MSSSKQTYLAEKYMSGPKADAILSRTSKDPKKKKRKRNIISSEPSGSFIQDDDLEWNQDLGHVDDEDENIHRGEIVIASDGSFKKRRREETGWETIRLPSPPPPADEAPVVVEENESKPLGGILSGTQFRSLQASTLHHAQENPQQQEEETVYRDRSGRKIDVKAEKAAAARARREQEEYEARKMEWGKGLVQREEEETRRRELKNEQSRDLARYIEIFYIHHSCLTLLTIYLNN